MTRSLEEHADVQRGRVCGVCEREIVHGGYQWHGDWVTCCDSGCTTTGFWVEKVQWRLGGDLAEGRKVVRIDGEHYLIEPDRSGRGFVGFGGREFVIEFTDGAHKGAVVTTRNLWRQGAIPPAFRRLLPDNARWVKA